MELTIADIINLNRSLDGIAKQKMKASLAIQFNKLKQECTPHLNEAEETRLKLVKEYGKENESGNVAVTEENAVKFFEEYKATLTRTVKLKADKLPIDALDSIELSPEDAAGFLPLMD